MKNGMKILALLLVAAIVSVSAQASVWTGGGADDLWSTDANWDVPVGSDGFVAQAFGDSTYDLATLDLPGGLVGLGYGASGTQDASMTFNSGTLTTGSYLVQGLNCSNTGTGTFNIGGTAVVKTSAGLVLGHDPGTNGVLNMTGGELWADGFSLIGHTGTGTLNMSGGTITTNTGYLNTQIGNNAGGSGTVNMSGGLWYPGNLQMLNGVGTLNLSGGGIVVNQLTMPGTAGDVFDITGTGILHGASWTNAEAEIDAAVAAGYITAYGGTGTIVKADGLNGYWEYTAVPEPATMILLGLGALVSLKKRKA